MRLLSTLLALLTLLSLKAANPGTCASASDNNVLRPITGIYALEWGGMQARSTYLSPIRYSGSGLYASGHWSKAMPFAPQRVIMHFDASVGIGRLLNTQGTAMMQQLEVDFNWGMSGRFRFDGGWQFTGGATLDINAGALYLTRNGNNPVTAIANPCIALRASASKTLRIGRLPVLISETLSLPTAGAIFSPAYGETYYEIYLGNHSGLVHFGWWGNNFRLNSLLNISLDFGRTAMSVGYRFDYRDQWSCNLLTRTSRHALVIGIIPFGLGMRKRHGQSTSDYSLY